MKNVLFIDTPTVTLRAAMEDTCMMLAEVSGNKIRLIESRIVRRDDFRILSEWEGRVKSGFNGMLHHIGVRMELELEIVPDAPIPKRLEVALNDQYKAMRRTKIEMTKR